MRDLLCQMTVKAEHTETKEFIEMNQHHSALFNPMYIQSRTIAIEEGNCNTSHKCRCRVAHPCVINFVLETFNAISEISRIYSRI